MPPTPSPAPIDVFIHTAPPDAWQIIAGLSPLAVLIAAIIGAFMALRTLKQKSGADNRSEWWKRTQWALDAVYSDDPKLGTVGMKVLKVLGQSDLAGPGELAVLEAAWENPLVKAEKRLRRAEERRQQELREATQADRPRSVWSVTLEQTDPLRIPEPEAGTLDAAPGQGDNREEDTSQPEGGTR